MIYALAILILLFAMAIIARGFLVPGGIYEYPTLFCIILLGFLGPQVIWILIDPSLLPEGAIEKTLFMMLLVVLAMYAGFRRGTARVPARGYADFSTHGLVVASAVASVFGIAFLVALKFLPEEVITSSQWTGTPTAYLFFARACTVAAAVMALVYAATGQRLALYIFIVDSIFILDRVLGAGRRGDFAEWLFIVFLAIWFGRSKAPRRITVVAAIALALFALNFIGAYRAAVAEIPGTGILKVFEVDWGDVMDEGWRNALDLQDDTASELRNAARDIDVIDAERTFDFGASLWNTLVFNYFPAQLFGGERKASLYLDLESQRVVEDAYEPWAGSTKTGLSDSFASFWYFGALIFGMIGYVMGRLYGAAQRGSIVAALFYMSLLSPALHALTHHTHWFAASIPGLLIYLLPILAFARFIEQRAQRYGWTRTLRPRAAAWKA